MRLFVTVTTTALVTVSASAALVGRMATALVTTALVTTALVTTASLAGAPVT